MSRYKLKDINSELLCDLTHHLISINCANMDTITLVDKLCRRNWHDIHCGWPQWSYYLESLLGGREAYEKFAQSNCE